MSDCDIEKAENPDPGFCESTMGSKPVVERLVMPFRAICPNCFDKIGHGGTGSTLVGYLSPPGHNHNDNCRKRTYVCKCGYKKTVSKINTCPTCDWTGKEECFCCPDGKLKQWPAEA
jgi:hypothetical protein